MVLEDTTVARVGWIVSRALGMRRAMSAEWLLATMRSWSPLATKTGWVMSDRLSGSLLPAARIAFTCASRACSEMRLSRPAFRSFSRPK